MSSAAVLTSTHEGVLTITINRPEVRNAIDSAAAVGIAAALDQLDQRDELLVGIVTGAGGTFSAGADLGAKLRGESPRVPGRGFAGIVQRSSPKPLIAAVEGYALAGGFEIALACDIIVAARGAKFGLPEVKRGLVATGGGLLTLAERIPYHVAMRLALTGDVIDASRAADLGIVSDLTDDGAALEASLDIARQIARNAPLSVRASKHIMVEARDWPKAEAFARQFEIADAIAHSYDAREGAAAFKEKREPRWTGR
ncbi:crotonase/enoyl-CoA hydratase family protein [Microcella sp.]|uniref:crotonase/enoyl-CoA hydratase family protein n=1 Tax=Microcella sp. TaxID=1913979 RepID=UPI002563CC51|nr:crotonase/enoyl-CoA hydratase family protein [Microcella sp.]MBX9472358.1 crotonase/enoyl-CoA hydratase family protein [Microcella sp.]